jgi:phytoene synthase
MGSSATKSNFYWGMRLMPPAARAPVAAIYAFCRAADDAADLDPAKGKEGIAMWRDEVASCYAGFPKHPVMKALHPIIRTRKLKREYFDLILSGMEMDLDRRRYADMPALLAYCDGVAGAPGLLVLQAMGLHDDPVARDYSKHLAYGLQITNILRDIRADVEIGRVYFPRDAMEAYGVTDATVKRGVASEGFFKLGRFMAKQADDHYKVAAGLPDRDLRGRLLGPEVMRTTYQALLHRIMKAVDLSLDGQVARLPAWEKLAIAGATWIHTRFL